jgi:lipopolysaccharide transport system ATP-binding protein
MSSDAIVVAGLGKQYTIGDAVVGDATFGESLTAWVAGPWRRFKQMGGRSEHARKFWALKDISFRVAVGEVIGIVGPNGAGKSTLLKVLSRITEPTEGHADITGRVASLLEVGTGFHPELSGRENIFLNGAILGMRRAEITSKLDEIVAFAEVEKFLDTAVKHYSSGMYLRLAFSVAASLDPDILLVDEVLAVGDIAFQNKCLGRMGQVTGSGRTVILVSHNLTAIASLTKKCLWLKGGEVAMVGPTDDVVRAYLRANQAEGSIVAGNKEIDDEILGSLLCELAHDGASPTIPSTTAVKLVFHFSVKQQIHGLRIGFDLISGTGVTVFRSYYDDLDSTPPRLEAGSYTTTCVIPANLLNQGEYFVTLRANIHGVRHIVVLDRALSFRIVNLDGANAQYGTERPGILNPSLTWETSQT